MLLNYPPTKAFTQLEEGGYSDDPEDSGNYASGITGDGPFIGSMQGVGAPALVAYLAETDPSVIVTAAYMKSLPAAVWDGLAMSRYWNPLQCTSLASGLDLSMFDSGWNVGITRAAMQIQWLSGVDQDGDIGPVTLNAISSCDIEAIAETLSEESAETLQSFLGVAVDGRVGPQTLKALVANAEGRSVTLLLGLAEVQEAYYHSLSNFNLYGNGWLNRTSARTAAGLQLAEGKAAVAGSRATAGRAVPAIDRECRPWKRFSPGMPILAQAARFAV